MKSPAAQEIHAKSADFVENLTDIVYMLAVKLAVPCVKLPKVMISYFNYFNMNSADNAFQLPYETWYVVLFYSTKISNEDLSQIQVYDEFQGFPSIGIIHLDIRLP